jgi:pimeloyl-ACP methyl ester carboxylesterase
MPLPMPELPGVTHRDVTVGGIRLHVAEAGEGPPILLQHGWPQHWWVWRRLIGPLAAEHRVICPDLRGFGWSDAPPGRYDKESLAGDLLGLLDELGLERVRLVGHDWGGFVGFLACLRAPERFHSFLALSITHPWVSPGPGLPDPRSLARLWYQFLISSPFGPALLSNQTAMRRVFASAGEGVFDEETLGLYVAALAQPASARASQSLYRTFLTSEVPPIIRGRYRNQRLTVPTRLVLGDRDPVLRADTVRGFEDHADDMSLHWVADSGHWLPEQRHTRVLEELAQLP